MSKYRQPRSLYHLLSYFFKNYIVLDKRNLATSNNFYHLENFPYKLPSSVKLQNALAELYNIINDSYNAEKYYKFEYNYRK